MTSDAVELRVGDRERRLVDEQLQAAVGEGVLTLAEYDERAALLWQARTRRELDGLVADLPPTHVPSAAVVGPPGAARRVVAVMSEERLTGALRPGQEVRGLAVMGKVVVDLRRDDLPDGTRVAVCALLGEVEVQVPPGTQVELSGVALMGERKVRVAADGGPVVHVDAYAVMGSVHVTVGDGRVVSTGGVPRQRSAHVQGPGAVAKPERTGRVARLGRRLAALAVPLVLLGGASAVVASGQDGRAVFGSTVVQAVEGVDTGGLVVFGSVDCAQACDGTGTGAVVHVRAVGGFGSVEVVTVSERARAVEKDAAEDAAEEAAEEAGEDAG